MSITGGSEFSRPTFISEIHYGGPAWRCGQLSVGDTLVSVNEHDLRSAKHAEAVRILSSTVSVTR